MQKALSHRSRYPIGSPNEETIDSDAKYYGLRRWTTERIDWQLFATKILHSLMKKAPT
jgi:hypothetical protein